MQLSGRQLASSAQQKVGHPTGSLAPGLAHRPPWAARHLLAWTSLLWLAAGCGRVGFHLLPVEDEGGLPGPGRDSGAADGAVDDGGCAGDGVTDDDYVPDDSCGVGHCRTTNTPSSCEDGEEVSCEPGEPLSDEDATCDGIDDDCDGETDEDYAAGVARCGVGACTATGVASCVDGREEDDCAAGEPLSNDDTTCDGIDDDCDGETDEDYVPDASCGLGHCQATNTPSSCEEGAEIACMPGAPLASDDRTDDGVDDDCDGEIGEDVCTEPILETYGAGSYSLTPPTNCTRATIKLWGGAGASGDAGGGYWLDTESGDGGAGGYAEESFAVSASSSITLAVGAGGRGCGAAIGANPDGAYSGGAGSGTRGENGSDGEDGTEPGGSGGEGGTFFGGGAGGDGYFGGGGGGAGYFYGSGDTFGEGGSGGAASVLWLDDARLLAGGGGGGGGAGGDVVTTSGQSGFSAGPGCSGDGESTSHEGGAGGGGGRCEGGFVQAGAGRTPHDPDGDLSGTTATGGDGNEDCDPGGDGVAVIVWDQP